MGWHCECGQHLDGRDLGVDHPLVRDAGRRGLELKRKEDVRMAATGKKKSYKGYISNAKGTAHYFATGKNVCLCGGMKTTTLVKRSRTLPLGAVKVSKKCESRRQVRHL